MLLYVYVSVMLYLVIIYPRCVDTDMTEFLKTVSFASSFD